MTLCNRSGGKCLGDAVFEGICERHMNRDQLKRWKTEKRTPSSWEVFQSWKEVEKRSR
jgi:hypothetical protein